MAFEKKTHELGWTDRELAYMVKQNTDPRTHRVMNITSIYRNMGYTVKSRGSVPIEFRKRVEALRVKNEREK